MRRLGIVFYAAEWLGVAIWLVEPLLRSDLPIMNRVLTLCISTVLMGAAAYLIGSRPRHRETP
jgi:hypothetical protein